MYSLPKNVYRERIDFSKIKTTVPIPNLIEIQKKSYERFLQMNRLPSEREDAGLQSVFKSVFPISDFRENSSLEFIEYSIGNWECKCGKLSGLHHLRKPCSGCGATLDRRPVRRPRGAVPALRQGQPGARRRLRHLRQHGRPEAEVRRRRVPGARHDLRRAAEGDDPARGLEQGPGDRRQDHPRHQGAGGLLRRHPADDRERDVHHQRHRARHRQSQLHRRPARSSTRKTRRCTSRRSSRIAARGWSSSTTPKNLLYVRIDRKRKFLATVFLRALGLRGADEIIRAFYTVDQLYLKDGTLYWGVSDSLVGLRAAKDIVVPGENFTVAAGQEDHARTRVEALRKRERRGGRDLRRRARGRLRRRRRRRSVDRRGDPRGQRALTPRVISMAQEKNVETHRDLLPRARRGRPDHLRRR